MEGLLSTGPTPSNIHDSRFSLLHKFKKWDCLCILVHTFGSGLLLLMFFCTPMDRNELCCTTLHLIELMLHCTMLHCILLHCIVLHFTACHSPEEPHRLPERKPPALYSVLNSVSTVHLKYSAVSGTVYSVQHLVDCQLYRIQYNEKSTIQIKLHYAECSLQCA